MTQLLALASAVFYGTSDFLGGLATKRLPAVAVTAWSQLLGLPVLAVGLLVVPMEQVTRSDLVLGAVAGLSGLAGLVLLYQALAAGRMAIAAPITGAVGAAAPVIVDLLTGTRLAPLQWLGIALAIAATLLVGNERLSDLADPIVGKAILAGLLFAGFFVLFHRTGETSGLAPLAAARMATVPVGFLVAGRLGVASPPRRTIVPLLAGTGSVDMAANMAITLAVQRGPLGISAVLGSLYPAVTVVLAAVALHEHPSPRQWIGVVTAVAAVGVLSL